MATMGSAAPVTARTDRDALITGDAVLLDLRPASFAARMLAAAIDGALQLGILILCTVAVAWTAARADLDEGLIAAAIVAVSVAAYIGYPVLCEMLLQGRSVGRIAMGTRVVRDDGGPVHGRQSLLRAVMAMLEIWSTAGSVALTCAVIDRKSRRLGDLLAGTLVIQERMAALEPRRTEVPVRLQEWVAAADVGRLPLALMQDIRSFLPRANRINPESRRQLSRDLLRRT
ncbi:MAG: RDD family protein, partial [Brachybacterium tyrofermentans]